MVDDNTLLLKLHKISFSSPFFFLFSFFFWEMVSEFSLSSSGSACPILKQLEFFIAIMLMRPIGFSCYFIAFCHTFPRVFRGVYLELPFPSINISIS